MESRFVRALLKIGTGVTLLFLYVPLLILFLYAFSRGTSRSWPPDLWTTEWFVTAWRDPQLPGAIANSLLAAVGATLVAIVLGSLASFAVSRFRFFGRDSVSFLLVLPIALPGIVTAIALSSSITYAGIPRGLGTIVIGHATFCIVVVFNNVVARLRRTATSQIEASADLGANGWQTFRMVTFPALRTALIAGGLLAFGLSFDEIVVTNFTAGSTLTVPIWVFNNIRLPKEVPIVNAVAVVLMLLSIVPVYFAQKLAGGLEGPGTGAGDTNPATSTLAAEAA
jgi:putative spermidine/putrescine transport system permease protein